ncbi:MAG: hypothetical protein IJF74_04425 [Clostridia bacterium]|nr:hypothetical protein [Clostridia bacterium]MBQ7012270.1 hypothetical protein [Clostridia bacterium]
MFSPLAQIKTKTVLPKQNRHFAFSTLSIAYRLLGNTQFLHIIIAEIIIAVIIIARGTEIIIIARMAQINKTDIAKAMPARVPISAEKEEGAKRFASLPVRFERSLKSMTFSPTVKF